MSGSRSHWMLVCSLGAAALIGWLQPRIGLPHAATSNTVLFDREIVRILESHCIMCHVEAGPSFSLASYEEAWLARDAIHDAILSRHMPPWPAVPGYGAFANANALTLREQRFIVSWVEGLGPRNSGTVFLNVLDPAAAAREEIEARIDFDAWALGPPDLEVAVPAAPTSNRGATGATRVLRTVIDPELNTQRWLSGLEYRPASRSSLRAVVLSVEQTGQWLATWTPWHGFRRLPAGQAFRLGANSRIVAEVYVEAGALDEMSLGRIGLHFAAEPPQATPKDIVLRAAGEIPDRATRLRLHSSVELANETDVLALWPAPVPGVESIELTARRPDGRIEILLLALEVPHEWPTSYVNEAPVDLPSGTELALTAYMSNDSVTRSMRQLALTLSVIEH